MIERRVFIGWDPREVGAYEVAESSLRQHATSDIRVEPLKREDLFNRRMLWRPLTSSMRQVRDHLSGAPQSTEFATSRFLVPFLQRTGWALFTDADVVFLDDVENLFSLCDDRYAVMCVKHDHKPLNETKMDGQVQTTYPRKNWSSVMLWNCDHLANERLDLGMVNWWPGALLHRFCWLRDEEIGALPPEWNWLVGAQSKPADPKIAHFTNGGPWLDGWVPAQHDEVWNVAAANRRS